LAKEFLEVGESDGGIAIVVCGAGLVFAAARVELADHGAGLENGATVVGRASDFLFDFL
jgi:hypothetical protein